MGVGLEGKHFKSISAHSSICCCSGGNSQENSCHLRKLQSLEITRIDALQFR